MLKTPTRPLLMSAALILCLLASPAAAPSGTVGAKDDVTVVLREKVIKNLSSTGLVLAFHLDVANSSSTARALVRYRYRVRIDQKEYLNMTVALESPLAVPPGGETLVALPIKISYENLRAAIGPVEDQALCDVVGETYFVNEKKKEQKVPFAFSGEFPIYQDPEVEILPLKIVDQTVGGADVVFRPLFRNFNGYELIVDIIEFELYFAGHQVLDGPFPGDKSLPQTGEKIFSLPFLVDFFEAGEEIREAFEKEEFPCRYAHGSRVREARERVAATRPRLSFRVTKSPSSAPIPNPFLS